MQKLKQIEWRLFHIALGVLLLCCLLAGLGIYFSWHMEAEAKAHLETLKQQLVKEEQVYEESKNITHIMERYYPIFLQLQQHNFLVKDQRLRWMNSFHELESRLQLARLSYEIESPTPQSLPSVKTESGFQLFASKVKLQLGLLHTGDLFSLFKDILASTYPGLINIQECQIESLQGVSQRQVRNINPNQALLKANCTLQYYSAEITNDDNEAEKKSKP